MRSNIAESKEKDSLFTLETILFEESFQTYHIVPGSPGHLEAPPIVLNVGVPYRLSADTRITNLSNGSGSLKV